MTRAEPYTKIVEELPEMRRDTGELVRKAVAEKRRAYVLVNNRSEWNAPMTVQALSEMLHNYIISGTSIKALMLQALDKHL